MFAPSPSYCPRLLSDMEVASLVAHPPPFDHLAALFLHVAEKLSQNQPPLLALRASEEDFENDRHPENESDPGRALDRRTPPGNGRLSRQARDALAPTPRRAGVPDA